MPPFRRRLHLFPSWEILPFESLSPHPDNIAGRFEGLYKLIEESAPILISTPAALMQRVIPKDILKQSYLYLVAGQDLAREAVARTFDSVGLSKRSAGRRARRFQRARRHRRRVFAGLCPPFAT